MTAEAHITVNNLTMAYGDFIIQQNLNFTVNKEDIFIIMGGSGCGKSTLLRLLVGLKQPTKGSIHYQDKNLWEATEQQRNEIMRNNGILYQSGALWSSMTLAENIALPLTEYTNLCLAEIQELVSLKLALVG